MFNTKKKKNFDLNIITKKIYYLFIERQTKRSKILVLRPGAIKNLSLIKNTAWIPFKFYPILSFLIFYNLFALIKLKV